MHHHSKNSNFAATAATQQHNNTTTQQHNNTTNLIGLPNYNLLCLYLPPHPHYYLQAARKI